MSAGPRSPDDPAATGGRLTEAEAATLLRWQRRMRAALFASAALLALAVVLIVVLPDEPWTRFLTGLLFVPLVTTGLVMQLTGRCPRCGARFQMESGLALPGRCRRCQAAFVERPASDA